MEFGLDSARWCAFWREGVGGRKVTPGFGFKGWSGSNAVKRVDYSLPRECRRLVAALMKGSICGGTENRFIKPRKVGAAVISPRWWWFWAKWGWEHVDEENSNRFADTKLWLYFYVRKSTLFKMYEKQKNQRTNIEIPNIVIDIWRKSKNHTS